MTDTRRDIARLQTLGQMLLDTRLSALRTAALARTASLDRLADLKPAAASADLPDLAALDVALRYQRWADQRRCEINLTLARQTAIWLDARADAAQAFGRAQALTAISRKLK